jgi:hypothetical protein
MKSCGLTTSDDETSGVIPSPETLGFLYVAIVLQAVKSRGALQLCAQTVALRVRISYDL